MPSTRAARIVKGLVGVLSTFFVLFVASGIYLYTLYQDLPDLDVEQSPHSAKTSVVFAADGSVLAEWHGEQDRTPVELDAVPQVLRDAVIAVEDERFYEHKGVDVEALVRTFRSDGGASGMARSGSTITQQLVNLLIADDDRTVADRFREALLAYRFEAQTDKDRVLEGYLNLVYFGHGWYGVEAASQNYFGKHVSDIDLAEAALLAAIISSPGRYSPKADPEASRLRRDQVIQTMWDEGLVFEDEALQAMRSEIVLAPPREIPETAPHFVEFVKQELIDELGVEAVFEGGLRVHTTLDPRLQDLAEAAAGDVLPGADDPEAAVVCIDHSTGAVLAMVGGRDFSANQFNLAAQGKRQPGSAFKPFVLAAAMLNGVSPDTRYATSPYTVEVEDGTWRVENYEGAFPDTVLTLRDATVWSVNAVYARLMIEIGPQAVVETARAMGIETTLTTNPAIALGGLTYGVSPLEMASAYGTIASGGLRRSPVVVTLVTDESDEPLYEATYDTIRVLPEDLAIEESRILHQVVTRGTGSAADFGTWSAGKTGTTQEYRDAWFVGYAGDLVTSVWIGYPDGQIEMTDVYGVRVSGGTFPARVWRSFMVAATDLYAGEAPEDVYAEMDPDTAAEKRALAEGRITGEPRLVSVCSQTLDVANGRCPGIVELYLDPILIPTATCEEH